MELQSRLEGVRGVELGVLVVNPAHSRLLFLLAALLDFLRGGPRRQGALVRARRTGLKVTGLDLDDARVLAWIREHAFDVALHGVGGVIYRRPLIDSFRLGLLNPHIGLLPKYRGRSVMEWSLLSGDPTGITTFFVDEGIDTGAEIVLREEVEVAGFSDVASAKRHLFSLDGEMFARALASLVETGRASLRQDPAEGVRWYPMSALFTGVVDEILRGSER